MTTVNCPLCDEKVRVPAAASSQARVQCPLCVEEFELAEALDQLAPLLVVIDDPAAAATADSSGPLAAPDTEQASLDEQGLLDGPPSDDDDAAIAAEDSTVPEFTFEAPSDTPAAAPEFAFESGSASGGSSATAARRARAQRPQKSAVKEMIKVVGGGVVGLTIAQLILWWLPGDWKRDPFELGPKIPGFASFIVSPRFRAPSVADQSQVPAAQPAAAGGRLVDFGTFGQDQDGELPSSSFDGMFDPNAPQAEQVNGRKQRNRDAGQPSVDSVANQSVGPAGDASATVTDQETADLASDAGGDDALTPFPTEAEDDLFTSKPAIEVPMVNLPSFPTTTDAPDAPGAGTATPSGGDSPDPAATADASQDAVAPTAAADSGTGAGTATTDDSTAAAEDSAGGDQTIVSVRNAPSISPDQLSTRLTGAVSASTAMDSATDANDRALAKDFYLNLAGLGEAITFVDQRQVPAQVNDVGKFALEVGNDEEKLALIGKVAPNWMKINRPHNGVVVYGTIEAVQFAEPYYTTSLAMPNKQVVQIVSLNDPSSDYQPQDRVLVFGCILDAPQENLPGYEGDATTIVLDGLHATLPRAVEN